MICWRCQHSHLHCVLQNQNQLRNSIFYHYWTLSPLALQRQYKSYIIILWCFKCSLPCPIDSRWTPDKPYNCTWTLVDSIWTPSGIHLESTDILVQNSLWTMLKLWRLNLIQALLHMLSLLMRMPDCVLRGWHVDYGCRILLLHSWSYDCESPGWQHRFSWVSILFHISLSFFSTFTRARLTWIDLLVEYRSAIFTHSDDQLAIAKHVTEEIQAKYFAPQGNTCPHLSFFFKK